MTEPPIDQRFRVLCEIVRAQHFAWREAVAGLGPGADPSEVVLRMWALTGEETARAYARRIDPTRPLAPQVAECIVWSSRCMGEDAHVDPGAGPDEAFVRHAACPWCDWHQRLGLLDDDRPGCDRWFASTIAHLNSLLGSQLAFETLEALPDGDGRCLRRIVQKTGKGRAPRRDG